MKEEEDSIVLEESTDRGGSGADGAGVDNKGDNRVTLSMNMMPTIVTNGDYGWRCVNLTPQERIRAFDTKENLNLTKDK